MIYNNIFLKNNLKKNMVENVQMFYNFGIFKNLLRPPTIAKPSELLKHLTLDCNEDFHTSLRKL